MTIELTPEDRKWCVRRLPLHVLQTMKKAGPALVLAGGFIRSCIANEKVNDIDLFTTSRDSATAWSLVLANGQKVHETDNAYSTRVGAVHVQVIHRWTFATPDLIVPSFDFTIARAAIWYDAAWKSLCDERFYIDLAAKRLVYCSPQRIEEVGGSLLRVLKFYQRGYRIPLDSMGAVVARLMSGIDKTKVNTTDESAVAKVVTGMLRVVDPNVDPEHDSHMPSMVDPPPEGGDE